MGNAPDTAGQVNNEGCSTDDKVQISIISQTPLTPSVSLSSVKLLSLFSVCKNGSVDRTFKASTLHCPGIKYLWSTEESLFQMVICLTRNQSSQFQKCWLSLTQLLVRSPWRKFFQFSPHITSIPSEIIYAFWTPN